MDEDLLAIAAAPTTRALVESLTGRVGPAELPDLAEAALGRGETRAALNLALAGALAGSPPSADLASRIEPFVESHDLAIALLGTVTSGLADALIESAKSGLHTGQRQGFILLLAARNLEELEPPDELLRRIRLSSRFELSAEAAILIGMAAREVNDPDVIEVARACVDAADSRAGRRIEKDVLRKFARPLLEALPEEAPPELYGGFTIERSAPRTGRNEPCPCGSGKKYKRCCLDRAAESAPAADRGKAWGNRARQHRTMSDAQFEGLHPLEIARIPPTELGTPRLLAAIRLFSVHRLFDEAVRFLEELAKRRDLPEETTPDTVRVEVLSAMIALSELDRAEEILTTFDDPDAVPDHVLVANAIAARAPDALERIEALADRALREPSREAQGRLGGVLLFFTPALGILLSRGAMDPAEPLDVETDLKLVEEARDVLLLPPNDPAWEIFDLLSERYVEAKLGTDVMERNEQLVAEAAELKRSVALARARERRARRSLELRERELQLATRDAETHREAADQAKRAAGPTPEDLERLRKKIEEFKVRIAEGNHERRELRHRLSHIGSRIDAAVRDDPTSASDEAPDDLESEDEADPGRLTPRIPVFQREFKDALKSVADHVARDALATAGALAATEPGAWSSVKNIRSQPDLLSCRIGRHRMLFRLKGEEEMEFCRLIHRRDLDGVLRRMG